MSRDADPGGIDGAGEVTTGTDQEDPAVDEAVERPPDVPSWEDAYLDEVAGRLLFNYDLERDYRVRGERFDLYGTMVVRSQKHMFHPALSFARHRFHEHLFARRVESPSTGDLDRLVDLGHDLAAEWIEPDEQHYSTDFTFVLVAAELPDPVVDRIGGFRDRNLLKYGYNGHYEINLVAVAPEREGIVASEEANVEEAFRLWDPIEREEPGLLRLISRRFQL